VLMVLLAREEKGWKFGSTRNKTVAGVRSPARCSGLRARGRRKKTGSGRGRCGGAGGARNWRGGAAEAADGGGHRSSGEGFEWRRE
jgi:hypothetical protein